MPAKLCPVTLLISLQYLEVEHFHRERQNTKIRLQYKLYLQYLLMLAELTTTPFDVQQRPIFPCSRQSNSR